MTFLISWIFLLLHHKACMGRRQFQSKVAYRYSLRLCGVKIMRIQKIENLTLGHLSNDLVSGIKIKNNENPRDQKSYTRAPLKHQQPQFLVFVCVVEICIS
jgi:hypothetical protein